MRQGCTDWPAEFAADYRAKGYWKGRPLGDLLRDWAGEFGDAEAVVSRQGRVSYRDLDERADRMAGGLRAIGIGQGDHVVVQLPNVIEFVTLCFAMFRIGALPVFALPAHRGNEITHMCLQTEAVACVIPDVHEGFDHRAMMEKDVLPAAKTVEHVLVHGEAGPFTALSDVNAPPAGLPEIDASDVAFFLLSGGTTALPKLIPRAHEEYAYQAEIASELCRLGPSSVYLTVLPIEFNFPWGCPGIIGILGTGGKVVLSPNSSPGECFDLIDAERVTITSIVPSIAHMWLEEAEYAEEDLSSLEIIQIGSAKLHREVAERIQPTFSCRLQQVFGMAEGLLTFTRLDDPEEVILASQGRAISPADEIKVADPADNEVPAGEIGELLTRGPYTLRGYYRADEHNAKAFTADGFYRSGDLVRLTPEGNMIVEGRAKDVVIRGGSKISSTEVEGHLTAQPNIAQAAVVPMPDVVLGECVCAYVIPDGSPPTLAEVRSALQSRGVAEYKFPDRLVVVDTLPLTGLGKVDKKELAKRVAE